MNFRSSFFHTCLATMIILTGLGWIYSYFPAGWYVETHPIQLLFASATICLWALQLSLLFPPLILVPGFAIWGIVARRPKKRSTRLASLAIPLLPGLLMPVWGAYCWIHQPDSIINAQADVWKEQVLSDLFQFSFVLVIGVLISVLVSKRWVGERMFAFSVLALQIFFLFELVSMASMPVTGRWL